MQVRTDRSSGQSPTSDEHFDLLYRRMAMLGLDLDVAGYGDGATFATMKQRCKNCVSWEACAADLKRDPSNSVWEAYCPNAGVLNALSSLSEVLGQFSLDLRTASVR